ncbi:DUF1963 domain-containing protein [Streptomyces sp. NL15-2K]|uniref:DUF1963 domain-containing protein n=1 Tax=Streptomyces sp. NL15-2K TaxID=376149 RepID=UPI00209BE087|nr:MULTISPECIES: DUF1963 domain-containing protein [Actinomycetes]WKX11294.1 DUF1963 domain-containing protein [Kutzneria buriramensis]
MAPEMWDRLSPFRDEAIARCIPADDIERWLATARPCATLTRDGDGPVVGQFGGPLLLPADTPDPAHPFVASIDLAALPADATDLPLPPDGQLLLFAFPEDDGDGDTMGSVVYIPLGTAVAERDKHAWNSFDWDDYEAMFAEFPEGPLRATANVSLPHHKSVIQPGMPWGGPHPGHPRSEELVAVWESTRADIAPEGPLQIGGYADEEAIDTDPVAVGVSRAVKAAEAGRWDGPVSDDVSDWVLLADWLAGMDVQGWESATVHWVIQREDLAARRFDRAFTSVFWNP